MCILAVLSGATVVTNPMKSGKSYRVLSVLGEGRWGIVHKVQIVGDPVCQAAMKSDKVPVPLSDGNHEAEVLFALQSTRFTPGLVDSFVIPESESSGKRFIVMGFVGQSLKQFWESTGRAYSELTVGSVVLQLVSGLQRIHRAGFYHNDLHFDNVAFRSQSDISEIILLDYGNARPIHLGHIPSLVNRSFSRDSVFKNWVITEYKDTDKEWFWWAAANEDDSHIADFIKNRQWSPEARIAIRNCRIFSRMKTSFHSSMQLVDSANEVFDMIVKSIDPSTDRDWFTWALSEAESDNHLYQYLDGRSAFTDPQRSLIKSTREIMKYARSDKFMRSEFARVSLVVLQMLQVGLPDDEDFLWFLSLMNGPKDEIKSFLEAYHVWSAHVVEMVELSWEVFHGRNPDYSLYSALAQKMVEKFDRVYDNRILF